MLPPRVAIQAFKRQSISLTVYRDISIVMTAAALSVISLLELTEIKILADRFVFLRVM
jgi:hypothetical protein